MKQLWEDSSDFIFFIFLSSIIVLVFWTITPLGHTITNFELEHAEEFCGDSGIYEIDTYFENMVTCNNGDFASINKLVKNKEDDL